ncbi:hypothetical protein D3C81_1874630 [compost metagenome]
MVPGAGLRSQRHRRLGVTALAHQIDRTARAVGALQQRCAATQQLHSVIERGGFGEVAAQRVYAAGHGGTVVLQRLDLEAS